LFAGVYGCPLKFFGVPFNFGSPAPFVMKSDRMKGTFLPHNFFKDIPYP
jgi:hypothetical protein